MVSMTTKTTPSRTGSASRMRRVTNVSIPPPPRLLVEPGLPEAQVVLDRVHDEALDARARHHDLLGVVDRDPHRLAPDAVLDLGVEAVALALVHAPARLLHELVDARVRVARGVPARGRHLLAVKEGVERIV